MTNKIIATTLMAVVVAGCSSSKDPISPITNLLPAPDWSDRVCESPVYREMIGTYKAELAKNQGSRSCRWNTTVVVNGESAGGDCNLTGYVESNLVEQGTQFEGADAYVCDSGRRDVNLVTGIAINDDLDTIRPVSLGFNFPILEAQDNNGISLVHPVTQFENMTVLFEGLRTDSGVLLVRQ